MVYRVFGPGLGDGACLRARDEIGAISAISRIFGLEVTDLRAAEDIRVRLPPNTIPESSGETICYVPSALPDAAARPDSYAGLWKQAGSLRRRRLLVVEDEYLIAVVIQNHLEAAGAIVSAVGSLGAAIEMIKSQAMDAAIVYINLRGVKAYPVADLLIAKIYHLSSVQLTMIGYSALVTLKCLPAKSPIRSRRSKTSF
ncbi:MAG: hypothetical protein JO223_04745 [Hyphomicrobiales bacterium]|nr:hypothetical protein [Hyphomicrobiales bacterium]